MEQEQHQTVCVPRELLRKIYRDLDSCQRVIHYARGFDPAYVTDAQECLKEMDALLAQPVASEPVAWQWLGTAHFRRKIPKHANACHWEPLYRHPPAPAVPEGYVLVPIEPTREMFVAANKADDAAFCDGSAHVATAENVWYAMVDAAPQPTTEGSTNDQ